MNEKINKYYKNVYLYATTIFLYLFIIILKNIFYSLFNINFNNQNNEIKLILNITYQIFAISISINFLIKNLKSSFNEYRKYLKNCLIAATTIIIYALTPFLELIVLYFARVNYSLMNITFKTIYFISFEILIMSIIALINNKLLSEKIKDFKINFKKYLKENIKYYIFSILVMVISNLFINVLNNGIASNEESIHNTIKLAPIYMFFSAVIFAPFIEEIIFRLSIRRIIKNDLVFIITSGLVFGGMHVIGDIKSFVDILYIIPYSAPGIAFALMLKKTNNILVPMSIHFTHNLILMTLQCIILL